MQAILLATRRVALWLGGALATLSLGLVAGASASALGTKALLLVPALAVGLILLLVPYSFLYLIVATIPVNVEIAGPITVARLAIVFGLLVAFWQAIKNQVPFPRIPWPEGTLGAAFFLWIVVATLAVPQGGFVARVGPHIIYAATFFSVLIYAQALDRVRMVMIVLVAVAVGQGVLVMLEAVFNFVPFGGWQATLATERGDTEVRVVGSSAHPIILAGFFQVVITMALTLFFTSRETKWRVILLGATGLFLISWWYTFARSSWIGMCIMLFVAMMLHSRPSRILALSGGTVAFILLWAHDFSPSAVIRSVENLATFRAVTTTGGLAEGSESLSWRAENWASALAMWADNPIFGVGLDQSPRYTLQYLPRGALAHQYIEPAVPHNMFLLLLAEAGLPALLLFLALWGTAFAALRRAWAYDDLRPYAFAVTVMMCGQLGTFFLNPLPREIWLTLSLAFVLGRMARDRPRASVRDPRITPGPRRRRPAAAAPPMPAAR